MSKSSDDAASRWDSICSLNSVIFRSTNARALVSIAAEVSPPRRFIAGTDVLALVDRKITELSEQMESHRDLSSSLDFDS